MVAHCRAGPLAPPLLSCSALSVYPELAERAYSAVNLPTPEKKFPDLAGLLDKPVVFWYTSAPRCVGNTSDDRGLQADRW